MAPGPSTSGSGPTRVRPAQAEHYSSFSSPTPPAIRRRLRGAGAKGQIDEYEKVAREAADVWREYGALSVTECVADDVPYGELTSFPRAVEAKDDETVVFSWVVYESRGARYEVNKKVVADPRMEGDMAAMPFDAKRMFFGGFRTLVEA